MRNPLFFLALSIILDVSANVLLKYSNGFRRKAFGISAILMVLAAFTCMVQAIKTIELSYAYAVWGGLGLVATSFFDYLLFGQKIRASGWMGIWLITFGVAVLNFA